MHLKFALLTIFPSLASAQCQLINDHAPNGLPHIETNVKLCMPQGENAWTFSMEIRDTGYPALGLIDIFYIYDNSCVLRSRYEPWIHVHLSECPLPYVIMENFLPLVLTISSVDNYLGDPYFSFYYGSGKFSIRNNHCGCLSGGGKGKRAKAYCKCAFPHDGNAVGWKNAGIEFKA